MELKEKNKSQKLPIKIRNIEQSDVPFMFNAWLRSFRSGRFANKVDNSIYFAEQHKVIEKLVSRCTLSVACNPEEPGLIYGFIAHEMVEGIFVLHYIYVKHTFRNLGIGKELLDSTGHDFSSAGCASHMTFISEKLQAKYNLVYHPYILVNYWTQKDIEVSDGVS